MIITKITGGLGNQLFQYAAGLSLSKMRNTNLKLDVEIFETYILRKFDLSNFILSSKYATEDEIKRLVPLNKLSKAFQFIKLMDNKTYYKEPHFHFDEKFYELGSNVYIKGYFQSEKYFKPIEEIVRDEFQLKNELTKPVRQFAFEIKNHESVSIHIRRGDYKNSEAINYHGILPLEYYLTAQELVIKQKPDAKFYIFTDDLKWTKEHIFLPNTIFVSGNVSNNHYEDFYLMTQCKHNIIANSSFSWWAAWLNNNYVKIVIAPKKWFNNGPKDVEDLIPSTWITI